MELFCGAMIKTIRGIALFAATLLVHTMGFAQLPEMWLIGRDTTYRTASHWVMTSGQGLVASDALDMDWTRKMVLGGTLERSELMDLEQGMKVQNRLGVVADAGVDYFSFEDSQIGRAHV